jgi:hypothetical protein
LRVTLCGACTIHTDGQATRSCVTSRGRAYDGSTAMKVPGVEKIIVIEGTPLPSKFQPICGVAVIALNCPEAPIR